MSELDRQKMTAFYDQLGEREWQRLEENVRGRVAYEVHRRFLTRFVRPGDRVLEIGAGPGRFTLLLAELGASVDVTDISAVQLHLHEHHVASTPAESAVRSRELLDVCDTSRYGDDTFDVVLVYGGPLSYAFEDDESALRGLFRVTKPDGYVVASVMSWLGSWRYFLAGAVEDIKTVGDEANDRVLATGDLRHFNTPHVCQMYRSSDVVALVARSGGTNLAMSASNWTSLADPDALTYFEADALRWQKFLDHEVAACVEPGALDGGTHLLFAAQPRTT